MNVVAFSSREQSVSRPFVGCRTWHHDELQRLVSLHAAHMSSGAVTEWDVASTEADDPQFYLIGPAPDHDCVLSVSRVGGIYVLQDMNGTVIAENTQLQPIVDAASRALSASRTPSFAMRMLFSLCAVRALIEQKLEPILAESTEALTRVAPQLAAFV